MAEIHDLSAVELAAAVRDRRLSPVEIVDHYLDRIDRLNAQTGAYITVTAELAREQALKVQQTVTHAADTHALAPLAGVPVPIKDLNLVAGVPTTFGSAAYAGFTPDVDDHVVTLLRDSGTILLGKTNTPEFGLPCYTENAVAPPARTPWDLSRSAGGSSGGAAAAVAAGLAPIAQGSDGGGSIRIPASVCGLVGLKPTRGRVSGGPVNPDLFGLSVNGPIARTVADAATLLDIMAGAFPGDMFYTTPLPEGDTFAAHAARRPGKLRIGRSAIPVVPEAQVDPECLAAYEETSRLLEELGHEVEDLPPIFHSHDVPGFVTLWSTMAGLMPVAPDAEDRLRPLTKWLREAGSGVGGVELLAAHTGLQAAMRSAMAITAGYDAVLHPTLAKPPVPIGYFDDQAPEENFARQMRFTPFCAPYNLSGQPAISVPLHTTADGLPIGVMLAGRRGEETLLIELAAQLEEARPWRDRHPDLW